MRQTSSFRAAAAVLLLSSTIMLSACATLPTNGPTAHQVRKGAERSEGALRFQIVDITPAALGVLKAEDVALAAQAPTLAQLATDGRVDGIGPGDVLAVSIFEVGVSLFGGNANAGGISAYDPSAHPQLFPDLVVNSDGQIAIPYVGNLTVAGRTPTEVEQMIDARLVGKSQSPQAIVTVKKNFNNTAYISGDVRKPGRFELTLDRERLLDAIAESGGSYFTAEDTLIRFSRHDRVLEERMGFVRPGSKDDLVLIPGDRIELIKRPRSYTAFGATAKASQISFETGDVTLAEAIARSGGPADSAADASAVFLFRFDNVLDANETGPPRLYRLNMLDPASYLLAQRVMMRDKDVLYFANAASNQPSKLVAILNQLFSPFVTARALSQ